MRGTLSDSGRCGKRGGAILGAARRACLEELGRHKAGAATGAPSAEPLLLQALESEDSDLREAAASALARVGTVASVQPLQEAAESSLFDLGLRRAARQAVAEIQSRLDGASPGQLSLAQAEAGQLSLASEAGQLSLAPQETEPAPDAPAVPQRPFEMDAPPQGSPPEAFRRLRE